MSYKTHCLRKIFQKVDPGLHNAADLGLAIIVAAAAFSYHWHLHFLFLSFHATNIFPFYLYPFHISLLVFFHSPELACPEKQAENMN